MGNQCHFNIMVNPFNPYDYPDEVLDELSDPDRFDEVLQDAYANGYEDDLPLSSVPRRSKNPAYNKQETALTYGYSGHFDNLPSKETYVGYWLSFDATGETLGKFAGKWLVFCPPSQVDAIWQAIRTAMIERKLGPCAKVSTALARKKNSDDHVICVYTKDHRNVADVMRVRAALREIGVIKKIPYKTNTATLNGSYAKNGKKVSKFYE